MPADLSHEVVCSEALQGPTTVLKVHLSRKVSDGELNILAQKLQQAQRPVGKGLWIYYLLGNAESDVVAVSFLNPAFPNFGTGVLTPQAMERITKALPAPSPSILGVWMADHASKPYVMVLRNVDGQFVVERFFGDGSSGKERLDAETVAGQQRLRSTRSNGDYYMVDGNGNLSAYDAEGWIEVYPALARPEPTKTLLRAAANGDYEQVELLLRARPDVNAKVNGATALHVAAGAGHKRVTALLLANGADPNVKYRDTDMTPLHLAWGVRHREVVELLVMNGADVNAPVCLDAGQVPKRWVGDGGYVNAPTFAATTMLHLAVERGDASLFELLLAKGAKVQSEDIFGRTALHVAAGVGNVAMIRALLASGAHVNAKAKYGSTPLHLAVFKGHMDAVKILLSRDADANAKDNTGDGAVHIAAKQGQRDIMELLLSKKANANTTNTAGETPLAVAVLNGHLEAAELLLATGATANVADKFGRTPLHAAVVRGEKAELIEWLLGHGAEVNTRSKSGDTPLHDAAALGRGAVAELLLAHGAEVNARDGRNRTPLDVSSKAVAPIVRKYRGERLFEVK